MKKVLIPALLKRMVQCHTGRGLNTACDCEFCEAKRQFTAEIGNANHLMRTAQVQPMYTRPEWLDHDTTGDWIWSLRRTARRLARERLQQLKEK